jgi:hypothetical protein
MPDDAAKQNQVNEFNGFQTQRMAVRMLMQSNLQLPVASQIHRVQQYAFHKLLILLVGERRLEPPTPSLEPDFAGC